MFQTELSTERSLQSNAEASVETLPVPDERAPETRRQALKDRAPLLPFRQAIDAGLEAQVEAMMGEVGQVDPDILQAQAKAGS